MHTLSQPTAWYRRPETVRPDLPNDIIELIFDRAELSADCIAASECSIGWSMYQSTHRVHLSVTSSHNSAQTAIRRIRDVLAQYIVELMPTSKPLKSSLPTGFPNYAHVSFTLTPDLTCERFHEMAKQATDAFVATRYYTVLGATRSVSILEGGERWYKQAYRICKKRDMSGIREVRANLRRRVAPLAPHR